MKFRQKKSKPEIFERRRAEGSESPKVFSYYARGSSNNTQNTGRYEPATQTKHRSYKRLAYLPSYIALCMLVAAGLYACWLQPNPKVVVLNKKGTLSRPNEDYQSGIATLWKRSILNQTKLTVQGATIKNNILGQYGELADAELELPLLGRRPTVVLIPAVPALQYISLNGAFYVSTNGKVMAKVTEVTENQLQNVPLVRDESGIAAEIGKNIIPEFEAAFLQNLSVYLTQEGHKIDSITLPAASANEADVRLAGEAYYIKFSTLSDPRQSVGAYQVVKAKLDGEHTVPKEYIDVRVEEKVFYK